MGRQYNFKVIERRGLFLKNSPETLIHHKIEIDYLDNEIQNMIDTINSDKIPDADKSCKNCAYARRRSSIDKM